MANTFSVPRSICVLTESVACLFLLLALFASQLKAQTNSSWNGGTGNWSHTSDWSPSGVPNNSGSTTFSVKIVAPGSAVSMDVLNATIDNLTLAAANSLTINAGNGLNLVSGTSANYGTISGPGDLMNGRATFNNYGTISGLGGLTNSVVGTFNNYGTLFNSGQFNNFNEFTDYGTLYNSGTILTLNPFVVAAGGILTNYGAVKNELFFSNAGTIYNAPGASITNVGDLTFFENIGTIVNAGVLNNQAGAAFNSFGTVFNSGMLNNDFGSFVSNAGTFTNAGTLINAGAVDNSGSFTNFGAVSITHSGVFNTSTNYTQLAGSTFVDGTLTANNGAIVNILSGTLSGGGTINGNVLMAGNMIAGAPGNPMTFNINGNYTQNATGIFTETISSNANGLLNISGTDALAPGASLNVQLVGGFDPKNGTSFTIMDYGSEKGAFTISDPYFNGGTQIWVITSYNGGDGDDVVLTAEAAPVATPEPGTMLLLGSGLVALGGYAKKKGTSRTR